MTIEEPDFRMISVGNKDWDLYIKTTKTDKDGKLSEKVTPIGYGMRMESCIKAIIRKRMQQKQETYSLKEYLNAYLREKEEFTNFFKKVEAVATEEGNK